MGLHEDVTEFCAGIFADENFIGTAAAVSTQYIDQRIADGTWVAAPEEQYKAEYLGVQQIVRAFARRFTPEDSDPSQLNLELPEKDLLQERYSVRVKGRDEIYVPRKKLSEEQMLQIVGRLDAISAHYARHARALRSSWYREHSEAA